MKRIMVIIVAMAMIISSTNVVDAKTVSSAGETASVPVKYSVNNTGFIIEIPSVINVGSEDSTFAITAENVNLRPDEELSVVITEGCDDEGYVKLLRKKVPEGKKVAILKTRLSVQDNNLGENKTVAKFVDSDESNTNLLGEVKMSGIVTDKNTEAGDYMGTLVFEVELKR